jgi:GNAT superfamily N-acetyltransferase
LSPPEGAARPEPATAGDIDRINRVFSDAFTERYQRDGMNGVRVPLLNPAIWRYAIEDAAQGAMIWKDAAGNVVAFNIVHRSGVEGWMGPLAVRSDRQGAGLGRTIVRAGIGWLTERGVRTIGLETMPRTIENIGFYSRLGFRPGHLTVSVTRDLDGGSRTKVAATRLSRGALESGLRACLALSAEVAPGVDYSREVSLTRELGLGDATLLPEERGGAGAALAGFALWHTAPLAEGRPLDEARVLKLVARDLASFRRLVQAVEAHAVEEGARRLAIRCQTAYPEAYSALVEAGYRVHWTDLRMTLCGREERPAVGAGVVFSNWEI